MTTYLAPIIFLVLSVIFLGFASWNRLRLGGTLTLSAGIWLRVGLIFAVVSGFLFWLAA